jgi:hypothetical protein
LLDIYGLVQVEGPLVTSSSCEGPGSCTTSGAVSTTVVDVVTSTCHAYSYVACQAWAWGQVTFVLFSMAGLRQPQQRRQPASHRQQKPTASAGISISHRWPWRHSFQSHSFILFAGGLAAIAYRVVLVFFERNDVLRLPSCYHCCRAARPMGFKVTM